MSFETLLSPIMINQMRLQNRIILAPMHDCLTSADGFVTPEFTHFYLRRAQGGASMLIIGAVTVSPGWLTPHQCLYDDKFIPSSKDFIDRIHSQTDTKVCAQFVEKLKGPRDQIPDVHDFTDEDIEQMMGNFERGAMRARESGFDAIEIHASHSWALAAFLSLKNNREDKYGGPVESRMKIVVDLYQRMRRVLGDDYPIGIRINGDEFIIDGNTLTHSTIIARKLAEMGIDYISVSAGAKYEDTPSAAIGGGRLFPYPPTGGYSGFRCIPPAYMPEGVNVYLADAIRKAVRKADYETPVMTAGRIPHPELAEAILTEGKADLIGLSRALMRDPNWPTKTKEGRAQDIAKCDYDNACLEKLARAEPVYCKYELG